MLLTVRSRHRNRTRYQVLATTLLHSLLPINLSRKFREEIQQRSPSHLLGCGLCTFGKHIVRTRLPGRRKHSSTKRSPVQSPLRPQMLFTAIIGHQIPDERMPRPRPQSLALALVITNFISQLRIAQGRQRVRRNKLPFPRRKPLSIPSPSPAPLPRSPARLIQQRSKHSFHVSSRRSQRLLQINFLPLLRRQRYQLPIRTYINSRNPPRLPIPRFNQPSRSRILGRFSRLLRRVRTRLHGIRSRLFFFLSRRSRNVLPCRLSRILIRVLIRILPRFLRRILSRILSRLPALRKPHSHPYCTNHYQHKPTSALCPRY